MNRIPIVYITPDMFAHLTSMSQAWVTARCRNGAIPSQKNGKYWRIAKEEALELFRAGTP